jgi:WD40 repeat protein
MVDTQPTALWIWDIAECKQIAIIQQTLPIKAIAWNPLVPEQIAFSCSNGLVYLWEKAFGCDAIEIPAVNFHLTDFKWNPDGKSLALMDKDKFCLAFVVP